MERKHNSKWLCRLLPFFIFVLLLSGCAGIGAGRWTQFHADGPNQGFIAVHSTYALNPKWTVDLGDGVAFSSPVLSKDGSIYVGASKGLVKVSQDGSIIWKTSFPDARILSSPAVGPDGNIYVISTKNISDKQYHSELHSVTSNGSINWSRNFGGVISDIYTTSSPKIWGNEKNMSIFVYIKKLYVFSQDGRLLAGYDVENRCTTIVGTSWFSEFFEELGKFFVSLFSGDLFTFDVSALNWHEIFGWPDPTVAIVSYPNTKFELEPLIVVANVCGMTGIQWKPDDKLNTLWVWNLPDPKKHTSPAVFPNDTIAIGREDGLVELFNVETGAKLSQYNAGEKLVGTPASILGVNFYATSLRHLHEFAANGNLLRKFELKGETLASPAVTADAVYISTTAGLETFALDYSVYTADIKPSGGVSSPAVGVDGTIYMITHDGQLRAYPGVK